jgi:hypothetical protein
VYLKLVTLALLLSFCTERKRRLAAILFGIPTSLLPLAGRLLANQPHNAITLIGHGLAVAFFFWAGAMIVASLFRTRTLTLDSVFGAICGYMLLGMAWGVLYAMMDALWHGSFAVASQLEQQAKSDDSRIQLFTYYSFITLATVGYGDVTPVTPAARTCAWLEAVTGQFYIAVLVAGLVGALLTKKSNAE